MNEREELQRAREELKSSIKVVQKNLKIFDFEGLDVIDYGGIVNIEFTKRKEQ